MSCWRVLKLSDPAQDYQIPQLLINPNFGPDSYRVFLTDLSNIWCEELALDGILDRASSEESPIEISKQDTTQLAILLENVRNSLVNSEDTSCSITQSGTDGVTLHSTINLPEPLDSLRWKFYLEKRSSVTLKNELILPLLISSHIQHERVNSLMEAIIQKDKAITRLVDQFESSNLDLAAAFLSIGGLKPGRKLVKRDQAAKHIPALQPFAEDAWKKETAQLDDAEVSTLGLFQEALSDCTPRVPSQLKAEEKNDKWWYNIQTVLKDSRDSTARPRKAPSIAKAPAPTIEPSEDETEDEFETHENFKTRKAPRSRTATPGSATLLHVEENDSTDEDEDLDAPTKSEPQRSLLRKAPLRPKSPISVATRTEKEDAPPIPKSKGKGFRIGGKAKKPTVDPPPPDSMETYPTLEPEHGDAPLLMRTGAEANITIFADKARKPFQVGGKQAQNEVDGIRGDTGSPTLDHKASTNKTSGNPIPAPVPSATRESTPFEMEHETPEEKAERKRCELKRKNEELAKKQAQRKKRKRF